MSRLDAAIPWTLTLFAKNTGMYYLPCCKVQSNYGQHCFQSGNICVASDIKLGKDVAAVGFEPTPPKRLVP